MRKVEVTREKVLELIKSASVPLTSKEMARILKVKERSVRAAITWLTIGGFIVGDGHITASSLMVVKNKTFKGKYKINLYKWTGKTTPIHILHIRGLNENDLLAANKEYGDFNLLQNLMMSMKAAAF